MVGTRLRAAAAVALAATIVVVGASVLAQPAGTETNAAPTAADPTWSLAAVGDSIISRRVAVYDDPAFMSMVKTIRDADAGRPVRET